ncbi:protein-methionine-sulfoxide reductase catalytic subunit MsrP [Marinagarivorans cellulosilyticus]|uniref:Protein-methionine-sulfoxide reductase catalytic subunit MsrP n=1 Tax=Marinagarivorans cellulosilyticus TaxID=2721545 RepID=A0AAN2BJL7_9GAMM|nr:protein-methionine-sulfoxide reductase catalytic subunit MsrP [Marinagarivorans cellulosilyticus]BCD97082.1 methionine sulfoxide reductase catalytic subunit [Marinagarivorans cellulosilyticus]
MFTSKFTKTYSLSSPLKESDVTPESSYLNRRSFLMAASLPFIGNSYSAHAALAGFDAKASSAKTSHTVEGEKLNSFEDITQYNNFYELGTAKTDPYKNADALVTEPWSVAIEGHCAKPGTYTLEDIIKPHAFEERIYRLRCVEAWSMVVPWLGFSLADLLTRFEPTSKAKYVAFETLYDPKNPLPGQNRPVIDWPYREGLRMDEAMHPLSFMALGLYGKSLPNQNGAPLRLVVPWKYGFKSIKSIVKIRFVESMPKTSWNMLQASEYGFYSNVNPSVSHPRWSQSRERRLGELFKRPTLMFNGYEKDVASLYKGMDLKKYF